MSANPRLHLTTHGRYQLLGRLSDRGLEALVELAGRLVGAKVAMAGLLQPNGGWFGEAIGVAHEEAPSYFPFCAYALARDGFFQVPDLRVFGPLADEKRVRGEPGLRMCAGTVLRNETGVVVGAFCAFDLVPRSLDVRAQEEFVEVARQIEAQLELRQQLTELRSRHGEQLARTQMLEGVLQAAHRYAILSLDPDGRIQTFNEGAERMLRARAQDVVGRETLALFVDPVEIEGRARKLRAEIGHEPASIVETLLARARAGMPEEREWTFRRRDGSRFPASLMIAAAHNEERELTGFVAIAQDITERRAAERMKDEFISIVSHELRTPLTAIRGSLGLVTGGALGPIEGELKKVLDIAHSNSMRMMALVDDILDLAKIESGVIDFRFDRTDVRALVAQSIEANRAYGEQYGVAFAAVEDRAATPAHVSADADRILQVLSNLLSNAAKFSPRGSTVRVSVEVAGNTARVRVSDHGPGIPEAFRPHIFERFRQAEQSDGRKRPGTGLGLSIVRLIVQNHSGRVGYDTELGKGTTFWFELPRVE